MQVRKLYKQQGIKPAVKQPSAKARIAALEVQFGINSQPKKGDVKQKEGETPKKTAWERSKGIQQ